MASHPQIVSQNPDAASCCRDVEPSNIGTPTLGTGLSEQLLADLLPSKRLLGHAQVYQLRDCQETE